MFQSISPLFFVSGRYLNSDAKIINEIMKWLLIILVFLSGCATKKISTKENITEHHKMDSVVVKEDAKRSWIDTTRISATRVKVTRIEFYEPDMSLKDVGALKSVEVTEYEHKSKDSGVSEVEIEKRDSVVVRDSLDRKVNRKVKEKKSNPYIAFAFVIAIALMSVVASRITRI